MVGSFEELNCLVFVDGMGQKCYIHHIKGCTFIFEYFSFGDDSLCKVVKGPRVLQLEHNCFEQIL